MLALNPVDRPSLEDCVRHRWLTSAQDTLMGQQYAQRIRSLALKSRLKRLFVQNCIVDGNRQRRESFKQEVASLSEDQNYDFIDAFNKKLLNVKKRLIGTPPEDSMSTAAQPTKKQKVWQQELEFEDFSSLLRQEGLDVLATKKIFELFDMNSDNRVNVKEMLLALVALRCRRSESEESNAAQLYFSLFDVNEDGYIVREELRIVLDALFVDDDNNNDIYDDKSIEDVFASMNSDDNGRIFYSDFEKFYHLIVTSTRCSSNLASF